MLKAAVLSVATLYFFDLSNPQPLIMTEGPVTAGHQHIAYVSLTGATHGRIC
ncbi:hypothetical protein SAMN04488118_1167 [Epibacterium ulvae]|uniref:Uncharacterized protein n=1 Tax=Epibacterium ulvae TaxID=1156985 RepID=A0A1G5RI21_9RHOB|nr:hypothetical protein SAMN04488118_1167 [Epibacterium ulvae]